MDEVKHASGRGTIGGAACCDIMRVYLGIDDGDVIQDARSKALDCGIAVVASSMAAVLVRGKTVQEVLCSAA